MRVGIGCSNQMVALTSRPSQGGSPLQPMSAEPASTTVTLAAGAIKPAPPVVPEARPCEGFSVCMIQIDIHEVQHVAWMPANAHAHAHVCRRTRMCMCVCVYMCTCASMHIYMHVDEQVRMCTHMRMLAFSMIGADGLRRHDGRGCHQQERLRPRGQAGSTHTLTHAYTPMLAA